MLKQLIKADDHIRGSTNATITLVEYGDYQCPYCGRAYPLIKRLIREFDEQVRFVFRNFPLRNVHIYAYKAALATEAASKQGKFWEMHDVIFERQRYLNETFLLETATSMGLDMIEFEINRNGKLAANKVRTDFEGGRDSDVHRTPTFFINGEIILTYNETYESLQNLIKGML